MEQSDRRPSSEEGESTQETRGSCSSHQSSLEMDCSEPSTDHTEGSNSQEMTSASSSLESYMDYSEPVDEEDVEENSKEDKENDGEMKNSCTRQNSLTLKVSCAIVETETPNGSHSQVQSPSKESVSQDVSLVVRRNSDMSSISVSVSHSDSINSPQKRKRKTSDGDQNMNKRREV